MKDTANNVSQYFVLDSSRVPSKCKLDPLSISANVPHTEVFESVFVWISLSPCMLHGLLIHTILINHHNKVESKSLKFLVV
jgi:hypothetical protein